MGNEKAKMVSITIDWTHEGEPTEVLLHCPAAGFHYQRIRRFDTTALAVDWAVRWFKSRGLTFTTDINDRQAARSTHFTMMAMVPQVTSRLGP